MTSGRTPFEDTTLIVCAPDAREPVLVHDDAVARGEGRHVDGRLERAVDVHLHDAERRVRGHHDGDRLAAERVAGPLPVVVGLAGGAARVGRRHERRPARAVRHVGAGLLDEPRRLGRALDPRPAVAGPVDRPEAELERAAGRGVVVAALGWVSRARSSARRRRWSSRPRTSRRPRRRHRSPLTTGADRDARSASAASRTRLRGAPPAASCGR